MKRGANALNNDDSLPSARRRRRDLAGLAIIGAGAAATVAGLSVLAGAWAGVILTGVYLIVTGYLIASGS